MGEKSSNLREAWAIHRRGRLEASTSTLSRDSATCFDPPDWFRTWSHSGVIPTAGRAQIFPVPSQEYGVLGICASNVGSAVARLSGEKFAWPKFQASMVQGLPSCEFPEEILACIKQRVDFEVNKRRAMARRYEPFQEFTVPAWIDRADVGETTWDLYSLLGRDLENKVAEAFGLSSTQLVELERDIREAVSIREKSEDRGSEDVKLGSSDGEPEFNVEFISEVPEEKAVGLLQYAVGAALGRWDVRMAQDPSLVPKLPEPFYPLPVCPPGMLVGPDGLPAKPGGIASEEWVRARPDSGSIPSVDAVVDTAISDTAYPLRINWDGILVDDRGVEGGVPHRDDIVRRCREVLDLIEKDKGHEIEQEACMTLGCRTYAITSEGPPGSLMTISKGTRRAGARRQSTGRSLRGRARTRFGFTITD